MTVYDDDLVVDFSNVKSGFETIPKGIYSAYIFDVVKGMSANSLPKLDITFKISEGEYKGRQLWIHPSLSPKSLWKIKKYLVAVGTTLDLSAGVKVSQIINTLQNKPCRIVVNCIPQNDFPNEITDVLPSREGSNNEISRVAQDEPDIPQEKIKKETKVEEQINKKEVVKEQQLSDDDLPT